MDLDPQHTEYPDDLNNPQNLEKELEWEEKARKGESNKQEEKREKQHPTTLESELVVPTSRPVRRKGQQDITGLGTVSGTDYHSNRFMKFQTNTRQVSLALAEHSGRQRGPHTQPAQSE